MEYTDLCAPGSAFYGPGGPFQERSEGHDTAFLFTFSSTRSKMAFFIILLIITKG